MALGGTLATEIQGLAGRMDHRATDPESQAERFAIRHPVKLNPNSCLAEILKEESVRVNSVHRQAIDKLAPRLEVEAVAEDGTVEAVSGKNARDLSSASNGTRNTGSSPMRLRAEFSRHSAMPCGNIGQ